MKNVLISQVNPNVPICGPDMDCYEPSVKVDENGVQNVVFKKVDHRERVKKNGKFNDWKLENLVAAGVDPRFPIHTSPSNRLEGQEEADAVAKAISEIADEDIANHENVES